MNINHHQNYGKYNLGLKLLLPINFFQPNFFFNKSKGHISTQLVFPDNLNVTGTLLVRKLVTKFL